MIGLSIDQKIERLRAEALEAVRRQQGLQLLAIRTSRKDVAAAMGVSVSMLNKWYYGQRAIGDDAWERLRKLGAEA